MALKPKYLRPIRVLILAALLIIAFVISSRFRLSFWPTTGLFCIAAAIDEYVIGRILKLP